MITLESPEIQGLEKEGDKDAITTVKLYLFINIIHIHTQVISPFLCIENESCSFITQGR